VKEFALQLIYGQRRTLDEIQGAPYHCLRAGKKPCYSKNSTNKIKEQNRFITWAMQKLSVNIDGSWFTK